MASRSRSQRPHGAKSKASPARAVKSSGRYTAPSARPSPSDNAEMVTALSGQPAMTVAKRAEADSADDHRAAAVEPPAEGEASPQDSRLDDYLSRVAPDTVATTFWVEPPAEATPADQLVLRLIGQHRETSGNGAAPDGAAPDGAAPDGAAPDRFEHEETVDGLVGGSGPVAITSRVTGIQPGAWEVGAQAFFRPASAGPGIVSERRVEARRHRWSYLRWSPRPSEGGLVHSCLLPWAIAPGTLFGVWALLAVTGIALALLVQGWLASRVGVRAPDLLGVSLGAVAGGLVGAKVWYMVVHRLEHRRDGWCIQGLISGVTMVGLALVALTGTAVGGFLDVTAPGLLFGMAVGRLGCFFGGCCYGRPTSSRLGVWSSDRRVGARRIPTQLLECALAASVGAAALAGVVWEPVLRGGVFVAAVGGYTLVRQRLLRWRAEPRQSSWLTTAVSVAAAVMLAAGIAVAIMA